MIDVDTGSFLLMVLAAAVASIAVAVLPRRLAPPVVVVELLLGILIGPQGLGIATVDDFMRRPAPPGASFEAPALKPG